MVMEICKNNNDGFGHLQKPRGYLSVVRGRKTACRSKPAQGITIKKRRISPEITCSKKEKTSEFELHCARNDYDLKKSRVYSRDVFSNCGSVDEYEGLGMINKGSYGVIYKVRDKKTGEIMAMKEEFDGLSQTSLTEIDILKSLDRHPSIVGFKKVTVDDYDGVYVLMEYMESDLRRYMALNEKGFTTSQVKMLMRQLLEGVKFLHDNGVMHRDLKPANVLVNKGGELKICDFGMSIRFGEALGPYSPRVGTLWYRAPELLLGEERYSCAVDMWAVGCIMAELVLKKVLFKGESEDDQLHEIYCILGSPDSKYHSSISSADLVLSESGFDLLKGLLSYDPRKRMTAEIALNHVWFLELSS